MRRKSLGYTQQAAELAEIKAAYPAYQDIYSQVLQDVLRRLDKAFVAFFRRLKNGEKPGYPRFQGEGRYDSFTYPQSGFALTRRDPCFSMGMKRRRLACCHLPPNAV